MLTTLSLTLSLTLAGIPPSQPLRAQLGPAAWQAAAQAPLTSVEWQQRHDRAEVAARRGTQMSLIGGTVALSAISASVVCRTGPDGRCDRQSRALMTGIYVTAATGAIVAVSGLVRRHRATAELRHLDAHRPR